MTSEKSFELIARYIVAANDIIDVCGPDAIDPLRLLLKAAHDEALKGSRAAAPAGQRHGSEWFAEGSLRLN